MEEGIEKICEKYEDCEVAYHVESGVFYYDMHNQYDNEMLVTFKLNSLEVLDFLNVLNRLKGEFYFTENWGEESGCEVDRVWIWW